MKKILFAIASLLFTSALQAQSFNLPIPSGSVKFGNSITVLPNGNYVVTDPNWTNGIFTNVGAVYLYNGQTNALISTLTGSQANDQVGNNGVTALTNGNYLVRSTSWANNSATNAGAVTWGDGNSGVNGVISTANSLVGNTTNDNVGSGGITALTNGNYLVRSYNWDNGSSTDAGAVTWGNGIIGVSGVVSTANSLVGSSANDQVGVGVIAALTNGNYVVNSYQWDNGSIVNAGAVTWGDGTFGITGVISISNSLVGSTTYDQVGLGGITALINGNYVVDSYQWDNGNIVNVGAVTWGNGTTGISGVLNSANSLVGSTKNDVVGNGGVTALTNSNYVVRSYYWDNGSNADVGAVTWADGNSGLTGVVSSSNSLVGSTLDDNIGDIAVTALTNGNYVVCSHLWNNNGVTDAGAVTWGNGSSGINGEISISNSLVGSKEGDLVGIDGVTVLNNGNYVVKSTFWSNGGNSFVGAITWGNGMSGITGIVSSSNSLVGSTTNDKIGNGDITVLANSNYVIESLTWNNNGIVKAGAVTWGDGIIGISGVINSTNSLVGTSANDQVGSSRITALTNGNYTISSYNWDNNGVTNVGAVTWANGTTGISGNISIANSLVGSQTNDYVGNGHVIALANGNYVVSSYQWDDNGIADVGAVTWANGTTGLSGEVTTTNSLIGSQANDLIGFVLTSLPNGNYVVSSSRWANGGITNAGAVTLGNGAAGTSGPITTCNSVEGNVINSSLNFAYNTTYEKLIVVKPTENLVTIFTPSQSSLAATSTNAANAANGTASIAFVDNSCQLVATLKPSGAAPVNGDIEANVYVENNVFTATDGRVYASRHYDISPATDPNLATSTVTLYYTQAEFDDYNANNGTGRDLPANPTDELGKQHVSIIQQHGTSASGNVDSYSGWTGAGAANVKIIPGVENVVWNTNLLRWEVTFNVTGFSGFFLRGDKNYPLAVQLVNFSAKAESNRNRLDWNTENETQGIIYEVERSADGNLFTRLGEVAGKGKNSSYIFYDEAPLNGNNYYRLKIAEPSGESDYSKVVLVKRNDISGGISVYPIPANNILHINYSNRSLDGSTVTAMDLQGRVMAKATLTTSTQMNIQKWPAGIYMLRFADGSVVKVVKK